VPPVRYISGAIISECVVVDKSKRYAFLNLLVILSNICLLIILVIKLLTKISNIILPLFIISVCSSSNVFNTSLSSIINVSILYNLAGSNSILFLASSSALFRASSSALFRAYSSALFRASSSALFRASSSALFRASSSVAFLEGEPHFGGVKDLVGGGGGGNCNLLDIYYI
jgi:hypothetical protein